MQMRLTNIPCLTTRFLPLPSTSTSEVLSVLEQNDQIDLTGFVVMCLDVWYGKTSNTLWLTRCGVDVTTFRIKDWSKNLGVIRDGVDAETTLTTTIREWDAKARQDTEVEFIDVGISDINDMINWLRNEKNVFYTLPTQPCTDKTFDEKVAEQQKKIDSYEATLSKITDIMMPKYAGPTWSETWEDLVERIKRLKAEREELKKDYANAKCARAELRYLYSKIVGIDARDDMSLHEISVGIHSKYKHTFHNGARYCDRMRELEQKLEDIKDICDGNTDVMNIIG